MVESKELQKLIQVAIATLGLLGVGCEPNVTPNYNRNLARCQEAPILQPGTISWNVAIGKQGNNPINPFEVWLLDNKSSTILQKRAIGSAIVWEETCYQFLRRYIDFDNRRFIMVSDPLMSIVADKPHS